MTDAADAATAARLAELERIKRTLSLRAARLPPTLGAGERRAPRAAPAPSTLWQRVQDEQVAGSPASSFASSRRAAHGDVFASARAKKLAELAPALSGYLADGGADYYAASAAGGAVRDADAETLDSDDDSARDSNSARMRQVFSISSTTTVETATASPAPKPKPSDFASLVERSTRRSANEVAHVEFDSDEDESNAGEFSALLPVLDDYLGGGSSAASSSRGPVWVSDDVGSEQASFDDLRSFDEQHQQQQSVEKVKRTPPPLPDKPDHLRSQSVDNSRSTAAIADAQATSTASPTRARSKTSRLGNFKRRLARATLNLTVAAHPTMRRLKTQAGAAEPERKLVADKYRAPLLRRYRARVRRWLARAAVVLARAEARLAVAKQQRAELDGVLTPPAPVAPATALADDRGTPLLASQMAAVRGAPLSGGALRLAASPLQLSLVALVPRDAWAGNTAARIETLDQVPCALVARRAERLVRCELLAATAAMRVGELRVRVLRRKLAAVEERLAAAPHDAPLDDAFFESVAALYATDALLDADASARSLESEAESARAAYAERCAELYKMTDKLRRQVVERALGTLLARDELEAQTADAFDAVARDRRTPQGMQLAYLQRIVADGGDADITPTDVAGFLEQFIDAMAERYSVFPEQLTLLGTLAARCVYALVAGECAILLRRVAPDAATDAARAAFVTGAAHWRGVHSPDALGVDADLWCALTDRAEARIAAGLHATATADAEEPSLAAPLVCVLPDAVDALQQLDAHASPADQLRVIQLCVSRICDAAGAASPKSDCIGADDLFPLVAHVAAFAAPADAPHLVAFCEHFGAESDLCSELGYCLTTFTAALSHISRVRVDTDV